MGPAWPGRIMSSGYTQDNGYFFCVRHDAVYHSCYIHLSPGVPSVGVEVSPLGVFQTWAFTGNSGLATAPNLHFQLDSANIPIDPKRCLPPR